MLPDPLHPAVVHFPIVLMVFLPLVAIAALYAIRRGTPALRAWSIPVAMAALLVVSAFVSLRTGQAQEEGAEDRVGEAAIETHEESAERFLIFAGLVLVVSVAGLSAGRLGHAARVVAATGAVALMAAGIQVGHTGGKIVYGDATQPGLVGQLAAGGEAGEAGEGGEAGEARGTGGERGEAGQASGTSGERGEAGQARGTGGGRDDDD